MFKFLAWVLEFLNLFLPSSTVSIISCIGVCFPTCSISFLVLESEASLTRVVHENDSATSANPTFRTEPEGILFTCQHLKLLLPCEIITPWAQKQLAFEKRHHLVSKPSQRELCSPAFSWKTLLMGKQTMLRCSETERDSTSLLVPGKHWTPGELTCLKKKKKQWGSFDSRPVPNTRWANPNLKDRARGDTASLPAPRKHGRQLSESL